jgi:hypothetical protein
MLVALATIVLLLTVRSNGTEKLVVFPAAGRYIVPPDGDNTLAQCSRPTPKNVRGFWLPRLEDIDRLELSLPPYLFDLKKAGQTVPAPGVYHRQYVGIIQNGQRLIYGNFYSDVWDVFEQRINEKRTWVMVCDGGPSYWGILYRPATDSFEGIAFNGPG